MTRAPEILRAWREDPVRFVEEAFQATPDQWQKEALLAFAKKDERRLRIALRACVGPGKSTVLAWIGWNFLSCYGEVGHHPKGAAVSITRENLRDNLWAEFSKWQSRCPYLLEAFTWSAERIYANDHPQTWFLSARSFSKTADTEAQGRTLSGVHGKYILFLIDESGDIPTPVLKSAEQALSELGCEFGRIIQAGNPSSLSGALYAASKTLAHLWLNIRITGDPDDPRRSPRIDAEWAREQIATYGRDNPWVKYAILGEFPPSSANSLLGVDEVEAAMGRHLREDAYAFSQKRLGVDVARFGLDRTVIFPRQGKAAFRFIEMRNARSTEVAARVLAAKDKWQAETLFVDGTGGYGAGVVDAIVQAGDAVHEVQFSGKAIDPRYYNKRSEIWFKMAEWVKKGASLPKDAQLLRELTEPLYYFQDSKLRLEEKDQIQKRLGFSPDCGDALAVTFAIPDQPGRIHIPGIGKVDHFGRRENARVASDWDPLKSD